MTSQTNFSPLLIANINITVTHRLEEFGPGRMPTSPTRIAISQNPPSNQQTQNNNIIWHVKGRMVRI